MLRAVMARFSGIFLCPCPSLRQNWEETWIQGGCKTSGKESIKKQRVFFPVVHSSCDISSLKPSSDSPKPKGCSPLPTAARGELCAPPPTPTGRASRAKSHRNASYCHYSLPEHMVSGIFLRVKCMNMHQN